MESMLDEVRRKEAALRDAMLASDAEALDALLSEELCFVGPDGGLADKAADLDAHRDGVLKLERIDLSETRTMDLGQSALVVVRAALTGTFGDARIDGDYRYTRVWHGLPGALRVVAGHCSRIA